MPIDLNFMISGEAGQGVQSVGSVLVGTIARGGYHVFADQDYENRVRGGHNFFRVRVSDHEVLSISEYLDVLIALNEESVSLHKDEVKNDGLVIFNGEQTEVAGQDGRFFGVPFSSLAGKNKQMSNTVAIGATIGLVGYDFNMLSAVLQKEFARLGDQVVQGNIEAAKAGYDYALQHSSSLKLTNKLESLDSVTRRMVLSGNEALALGAMVCGCKFIAGYPMTPSTPILEYIADKGNKYNVVAVHVEDEIAAINMAIGAAFTGVRAMVATSGGGFSLMVEGISLAGITETPVVIVLGQRPGPATGMPTRTEQGELEFAMHAGHGEFPRVVLAPSTVEDMFHTVIKAFNLAEKYQTPVIILTDHHIATSYKTVNRFNLSSVKVERGELITDDEADKTIDYRRHLLTENGVSPRALPLQGKALVVTDSDEHDEAGHMIEDEETRKRQNLKRLRKLDTMRVEIKPPEVEKSPGAELTFIGWGSTYGAIKEAAEMLKEDGISTNIVHFNEMWPFSADATAKALDSKWKNIVIEGNATAQLAGLISAETGIKVSGSILRFDGRPISAGYIIEQLKKDYL